jgi:hypothetical protein
MEHTPGLETSPPGGDTFDVAGGVSVRMRRAASLLVSRPTPEEVGQAAGGGALRVGRRAMVTTAPRVPRCRRFARAPPPASAPLSRAWGASARRARQHSLQWGPGCIATWVLRPPRHGGPAAALQEGATGRAPRNPPETSMDPRRPLGMSECTPVRGQLTHARAVRPPLRAVCRNRFRSWRGGATARRARPSAPGSRDAADRSRRSRRYPSACPSVRRATGRSTSA